MKDYIRRLKTHPGVPVAAIVHVLLIVAGMQNKSLSISFLIGCLPWLVVLISNRKK